MTAVITKASGAEAQPRGTRLLAAAGIRLPRIGRAAVVATALLVPGLAQAQGIVVIDIPDGPPKPAAASNVCVTGLAAAKTWMANIPLLREVRRNAELFVLDKGTAVPATAFYSDASNSRLGAAYRSAVQSRVRRIESELDEVAIEYFTSWQPACEACVRFRSWWTLFELASRQQADLRTRQTYDGAKPQGADHLVSWRVRAVSNDPTRTAVREAMDSIDVKMLTPDQVEFNGASIGGTEYLGVSRLAEAYNQLASLRPAQDSPNPDTAKCQENLLPKDSNKRSNSDQCRVAIYEQVLDGVVAGLVGSLKAAATQSSRGYSMMQLLRDSHNAQGGPLYDRACPSDAFANNWQLRRYYESFAKNVK